MQKWEYLFINVDSENNVNYIDDKLIEERKTDETGLFAQPKRFPDFRVILSELGQEGWELVDVYNNNDALYGENLFAIVKRPLED